MRLVACSNCHTQYDVTDVQAKTIPCRCGEEIDNIPLQAKDARIARCGSCGAGVQRDAKSCQYCGSEILREPGEYSLICPECDGYMARRNYRNKSGVIIDTCSEHGVWLDADELEQVAGFILSGAAGEQIEPESAEERKKKVASAAALARLEGKRANRQFNQTPGFSSFSSAGSAVESIASLLVKILN